MAHENFFFKKNYHMSSGLFDEDVTDIDCSVSGINVRLHWTKLNKNKKNHIKYNSTKILSLLVLTILLWYKRFGKKCILRSSTVFTNLLISQFSWVRILTLYRLPVQHCRDYRTYQINLFYCYLFSGVKWKDHSNMYIEMKSTYRATCSIKICNMDLWNKNFRFICNKKPTQIKRMYLDSVVFNFSRISFSWRLW